MNWECYFDEINKNKMIIVGLNKKKGSIELRFMKEEEDNGEKDKMKCNKKIKIELKNYEFNHEKKENTYYSITSKDKYLVLYEWGIERSKWLYYIDTDTGETLCKTEINGVFWSYNVFCVSKSNDIICYSNDPPLIYYLELTPQKLNKIELINENNNKKYEGKIGVKKQNDYLIFKE